MSAPIRDFIVGDIVKEAGTNIRAVVKDIETHVERIKIRIINGTEEGEEMWVDALDYDLCYSDDDKPIERKK
ncbi:MAG: hypothetical protein JRI77_11710 [Deltaproteobacteria bacterium]|nr:hypothetical protein [Deltaproteobacteria bacterium]